MRKNPTYPPVIPDIKDWPIYKLHQNRKQFIEEIDEFTLDRLLKKHGDGITDLIAKTIYLERIRIKEDPWKVDPPDERQFWRRIRSRLVRKSLDRSEDEALEANKVILQRIIHRYSEEIVGTFKIKTFLFARKFLTFFFNRLLNTAASRNFRRIYNSRFRLYQRLIAKGELEKLRSLTTKGTVVIVPTHFSNLDSMIIGYVLDAVLGLPSFSYGAGLNLYNTGYTAYYMNRLGAYRVDRRKKNPIYLEVLKSMSTLSIKKGTNTLFFPGGTRSRNGALETRLKMGLLGTAVEAQRALAEEGEKGKVFIVPLILCYHVVLEAPLLIDQYLKRTGKEFYIKGRPEIPGFRKIMRFAWNLFSRSSSITFSFGKPMDVVGNFVDEEGTSYDRFGNPVDIRDYFISDGKIGQDLQREAEYTRILADRIVERFHKENIVLSSHLIAFAAFNMLRKENPALDLYGLLRLPTDDMVFNQETLADHVKLLQEVLKEMEAKGKIKLSEPIGWDANRLIRDGVRNLGVFHSAKALRFNKKGELISDNFKLLFFYHNRLENYGLEKVMAGQFELHE